MICLVLALFVGVSLGDQKESSSRSLQPQVAPPPPTEYPGGCQPTCGSRACGDNGCGGSCGTCYEPQVCREGSCVCQPNCGSRTCGDNGCNGTCGTCYAPEVCREGSCVCQPNCGSRTCGDNGCGGNCGTCYAPEVCREGSCVCQPNCGSRTCGENGCGGTCGSCGYDQTCRNGTCVTTTTACQPNCGYPSRECGSNGCGGSCGNCYGSQVCSSTGRCVTPTTTTQCQPNCGGYPSRECGSNGCGGSCGNCYGAEVCSSTGRCVAPTTTTAQPYPPSYQPNWECVPGYDAPLSLTQGGDVQCMSTNGKDCLWYGACAPKLTTGNLRPLVCGAAHLLAWGSTGYNSENHWCSKARIYFNNKPGWRCLYGISTPVGINSSGDIQCMSLNARDCLWGGSCETKLQTPNVKPLVCGSAHQAIYGSTGYNSATHWCSLARAVLQPNLPRGY